MNRYPLWKYCLIAVIMVLGILYALPNLFGEDPAVQISSRNGAVITPEVLRQVANRLEENQLAVKSMVKVKQYLIISREFTMFSKRLFLSSSTVAQRFFCSTRPPHRLALLIYNLREEIKWENTTSREFPYKTTLAGEEVTLRFNSEWPDRDLYTAIDKDGEEILEIGDVKNNQCIWVHRPDYKP